MQLSSPQRLFSQYNEIVGDMLVRQRMQQEALAARMALRGEVSGPASVHIVHHHHHHHNESQGEKVSSPPSQSPANVKSSSAGPC